MHYALSIMPHRLTLRQREFCRLYAQGIPASKAAHAAGFAKSTSETNAARLLASPLVQARILRLRHHTLVRAADLEEMRHITQEVMRNTSDDRIRLAAVRRLQSLEKQTLHPLDAADDEQYITELVLFPYPQITTPQIDAPASEVVEYQEQELPEESDTLPDGITPAFDQSVRSLKPIEPPKPPQVITVQNLLPRVFEHHLDERTGHLTLKTNAEIAAEYLALPEEQDFDPIKGYPGYQNT